ncbi:MAG TPA: N-acetyltransferase, partial [Gemmatimonadales bacterium]|nr:N-acetyltransferase [Gemmatimonadales bacterium]
ITLGEYSFIGAGAVVRSDVPDFALMVGVPARRVGWMCQCGVRLQLRDGRAVCGACGATYREQEGLLQLIDPPRSTG